VLQRLNTTFAQGRPIAARGVPVWARSITSIVGQSSKTCVTPKPRCRRGARRPGPLESWRADGAWPAPDRTAVGRIRGASSGARSASGAFRRGTRARPADLAGHHCLRLARRHPCSTAGGSAPRAASRRSRSAASFPAAAATLCTRGRSRDGVSHSRRSGMWRRICRPEGWSSALLITGATASTSSLRFNLALRRATDPAVRGFHRLGSPELKSSRGDPQTRFDHSLRSWRTTALRALEASRQRRVSVESKCGAVTLG
jgi:hypothetical protein